MAIVKQTSSSGSDLKEDYNNIDTIFYDENKPIDNNIIEKMENELKQNKEDIKNIRNNNCIFRRVIYSLFTFFLLFTLYCINSISNPIYY